MSEVRKFKKAKKGAASRKAKPYDERIDRKKGQNYVWVQYYELKKGLLKMHDRNFNQCNRLNALLDENKELANNKIFMEIIKTEKEKIVQSQSIINSYHFVCTLCNDKDKPIVAEEMLVSNCEKCFHKVCAEKIIGKKCPCCPKEHIFNCL